MQQIVLGGRRYNFYKVKNLNCVKIFATPSSFMKVQDLKSTIAYCQTVFSFFFLNSCSKMYNSGFWGGGNALCSPCLLVNAISRRCCFAGQILEVPSSMCWHVPKEYFQ